MDQEKIINDIVTELTPYLSQFTKEMMLRQSVSNAVNVMVSEYFSKLTQLENDNYKLELEIDNLKQHIYDTNKQLNDAVGTIETINKLINSK